MKYKIVVKFLSLIVGIISASMVLPWLWAVREGTSDGHAFISSICIGAVVSSLAWTWSKNAKISDLGAREAFACVTFSWIVASFIGSIPYLLSGCHASFTDAFFETMSGFSTTGATIFVKTEELPQGILLWRALTQWLGGMGIVVLAIAVAPILGGGVNSLFKAESPGPVLQKITPTINGMSKHLWNVYMGITILCVVFLKLGGMPLFDSLCHTFAAVSTGGFSTKTLSLGFYNSAYFEFVLTATMFVCGINFALHLTALAKRNLKAYTDNECVVYVKLILGSTALIMFFLRTAGGYKSLSLAFRHALFQVVSIMTTTGFSSTDYSVWPPVTIILLFILMIIGGCAGSTAGGIKCIRLDAAWQSAKVEIKRLVHPNAVMPVRVGNQVIENRLAASAAVFAVLYLLIFAISTIIICASGHKIMTSSSAVAATLGNIGPGFGEVGPSGNFAHLGNIAKWVCSSCMLLGRLELYTVLVLLSRDEWVK